MPLLDGDKVILRLRAIHASTINPRNITPIHPHPNLVFVSNSQALKNRIMHGLFSWRVEKNPFIFISVLNEPLLQNGLSGAGVTVELVVTDEPVVSDERVVTDEPVVFDEIVVSNEAVVTDEPVVTDELVVDVVVGSDLHSQ